MNTVDFGKLLISLRKEKQYTQLELANHLNVSDKAVSKWERGICFPDIALFQKLSMLLDVDVEYLVSNQSKFSAQKWCGEIHTAFCEKEIGGKPILFYLLSYLMLIGITDVSIITPQKDFVKACNLESYGLKVSFFPQKREKTVLLHGDFLLFGPNLTRYLQACAVEEKNIQLSLQGKDLPLAFIHGETDLDPEYLFGKCKKKILGRGMIYIPLETEQEREDASRFVEIYETYHGKRIADLQEISRIRDCRR